MKRAIVIGATSGIGKELSILLAANGYKVGLTGRRIALLDELRTTNPSNTEVMQMDVRETDSLAGKLDELTTALGGLDLLIISAGTGELNPDLTFSLEKDTIDTNVLGFTSIADWAFNYFQQQGSGHLVGISSIAGLRGSRIAPSYNASKAYQINYMEGLTQKAKKLGSTIHVTDIRPGFVDTAMAKGEGQFWVAPANLAAKQLYNAIQRKRRVAYITTRWGLIALLLKLMPGRLYARM